MAIEIKHSFVSLKGDGVDPTQVQPSNWNEAHSIQMATAKVIGRATAGTGAAEELDAGTIGRQVLAAATINDLAAIFGIMSTGDAKLTFKTTADSGWILLDDGSIGKTGSGATTRANDDTEDLYTLIWNAVSDTYAPVSSGRGGSAAADWAASKTLTMPKALGRALIIAGAGAGLTSRTLGATFGNETFTLLTANLPPYTPSGSIVIGGSQNVSHLIFAPGAGTGGAGAAVNNGNTLVSGSNFTGTFTGTAQGGTSTPVDKTPAAVGLNIMVKL